MLERRRLKVEMVLPQLLVGGMEVVTTRLARALSRHGHDVGVTCIVGGGPVADALRSDGHRVTVVPAPGLSTYVRAPRLERWFRNLRPDIVHTHSGTWLKAVRAARRAGVPAVIHTEHGLFDPEPWYGAALRRLAARHTDAVVAVSKPLRDVLVHQNGLDPKMVHVIPNGVDVDRFRPGPRAANLRQRLGITEGRLLIGTVGRLAPVKNHEMLLDAFAQLHACRPDAALVIIGAGALKRVLEERIASHRLGGHAFLFGEANDVASLYRELDLFILSSKHEGMPMSMLEAMASGVPVVATRVGGIPDLLADGRLGWLVPPDDFVALGKAMEAALQDLDRRRAVASDARSQIVNCYSEAAMVEQYERLYYEHVAPQSHTSELVPATV